MVETTFYCNKSTEKIFTKLSSLLDSSVSFLFFSGNILIILPSSLSPLSGTKPLGIYFPMRPNSKARRPLSDVSYPLHSSAYWFFFCLFFVVVVVVVVLFLFVFCLFFYKDTFDHESD